MILKQLFDEQSHSYTYLLACEATQQAVLIDPVLEKTDLYLQLLRELGLVLHSTLDTHTHADHISAMGNLRKLTGCQTRLAAQANVSCIDEGLHDGDSHHVGSLVIKVLYTPGHTDDSYCFYVKDGEQGYVFTGDTLLIRGCGRTDFQNGNPAQQYHSLHSILLKLPEHTVVYPGHDYRGFTASTIAEEKHHNPRLQTKDEAEFVVLMNSLNLPNPKLMDIAVAANRNCGMQ